MVRSAHATYVGFVLNGDLVDIETKTKKLLYDFVL